MTKILLVEDDKSLREIYGVRLLAEGYDIVSAGDGEEALAMAIKEKPTLIISDVMMPKISGFDMLDILRSTTETRDIKVIMMTALSSEDQRTRGEQLGADRYLVKSQVGIEDVIRTVHDVLGDTPSAAATAAMGSAAPVAPTPVATPATPVTEPVPEPVVSAVPAPEETEGAGPLPPQPQDVSTPVTEAPVVSVAEPVVEPASSELPQPTAPFSSPRPTNLGEQVLRPEATTEVSTEETSVETSSDSTSPVTDISDIDTTLSQSFAESAPATDAQQPTVEVSTISEPTVSETPVLDSPNPSTPASTTFENSDSMPAVEPSATPDTLDSAAAPTNDQTV